MRGVGQRASGQHGTIAIPPSRYYLLVDRSVIGESGEREPEVQVALYVDASRIQAAHARSGELAAVSRYQSLGITANRGRLRGRQRRSGKTAAHSGAGIQINSERLRGSTVEISGPAQATIDLKRDEGGSRGV